MTIRFTSPCFDALLGNMQCAVMSLTWLLAPGLAWLLLRRIHPFIDQSALSAFKLHLKTLMLFLSLLSLAGLLFALILLLVHLFDLVTLLGMGVMFLTLPVLLIRSIITPIAVLLFHGFTALMFINGAIQGRLYSHPKLPFTPQWLKWLDI